MRLSDTGTGFRRSLLFAYLETLTSNLADEKTKSRAEVEYQRISKLIRDSKDMLVAIGYDEFALETFYDVRQSYNAVIPYLKFTRTPL
jgi:methionine synthase I (cobalamin-dependent)